MLNDVFVVSRERRVSSSGIHSQTKKLHTIASGGETVRPEDFIQKTKVKLSTMWCLKIQKKDTSSISSNKPDQSPLGFKVECVIIETAFPSIA